MEERGVPVQDDWSMAPDDDMVRFSLSGVIPHSWRETVKCKEKGVRAGDRLQGVRLSPRGVGVAKGPFVSGLHTEEGWLPLLSLRRSPGPGWPSPRGDANFSQHILPEAQHLLGPHKDCSSGDTGHPAAVTREHPRFPQDSKLLSF